jgi:hypothetical protein
VRREGYTLLNVKPAVGFTLPSAGATPAPGNKNGNNSYLINVEVDSATSVTILPVAEKVAAVGS